MGREARKEANGYELHGREMTRDWITFSMTDTHYITLWQGDEKRLDNVFDDRHSYYFMAGRRQEIG
jgi:hypothetical protein